MRFGLETFNIKVGLVKAVEEYKGVSTSAVEPLGHVDHGAEEWRQFDGNGNPQAGFYLPHELAITILNFAAAFMRVGLNRVEVELHRVSAGLLHLTGIVNPAAWSGPIQARDDGNGDSLFRLVN